MRIAICGCALLMAICVASAAQDGRGDSDESGRILSLENAWNAAELKHDARALNMLLAEAFTYTNADGTFMDRSQWLGQVKDEKDQYEQLRNSGMTVHVYGNAAVVTGKYREKVKIGGRAIVRSGRFTDTWIRQNGEWRCAASQATLINL